MAIDSPSVQRMLITRGEQVTLRRIDIPPIDVLNVWAKIDGANDEIVPGNITQFRRVVRISNEEIAAAGWPSPIIKGDQIIDSGGKTLTVQAVDTARLGGADVMHTLQTMGS